MDKIYLAVERRLKEKVPELRWIDLESGQLEPYDKQPPPVSLTCALVDMRFVRCADQSRTNQQVEVRIIVRVAWEAWADETGSLANPAWRTKALAKMRIADRVYCALQGWGCEYFSALSRVSVEPEKRSDGLKVVRIEFSTTLEDSAEEE